MARLPAAPMPTVDLIFDHARRHQPGACQDHLDAAAIGGRCARAAWYRWRWVTPAARHGRAVLHAERERAAAASLTAALSAAGVAILTADEAAQPWLLRAENGHIGGTMDAVALGLPDAPKTWHAVMLAAVDDKAFRVLVKAPVAEAAPALHAEMQILMSLADLSRTMFLVLDLNDGDLHQERIAADPAHAIRLLAHGERIVAAPEPPEGISRNASWFECRMCPHAGNCHGTILPPKNCRTCMHATPIEAGEWRCDLYGKNLSRGDQERGCSSHLFIPSLVAGEQIDVIHKDGGIVRGIVYQMRDGVRWIDGDLSLQLDDEIPF